MKNDIELRHIFDLARRSYQNNQFTFTDFLSIAQITDFYDNISELPPCGYTVSGGYEGAERVVIRFGSKKDLGYEEPFPFVCIRIEPVSMRFADNLSHRDVLGSIMNIGMEREKLGDIMIRDNIIWVMAMPSLATVIMDELSRIKHTTVACHLEEGIPKALAPQLERITVQAASERIDGIISKLCKLSRNSSSELFLEGKIAVNGREMKNHSYNLKEGDVLSVRGFGKFRYVGIGGTTKKGNNIISVDKYV